MFTWARRDGPWPIRPSTLRLKAFVLNDDCHIAIWFISHILSAIMENQKKVSMVEFCIVDYCSLARTVSLRATRRDIPIPAVFFVGARMIQKSSFRVDFYSL